MLRHPRFFSFFITTANCGNSCSSTCGNSCDATCGGCGGCSGCGGDTCSDSCDGDCSNWGTGCINCYKNCGGGCEGDCDGACNGTCGSSCARSCGSSCAGGGCGSFSCTGGLYTRNPRIYNGTELTCKLISCIGGCGSASDCDSICFSSSCSADTRRNFNVIK